MEDYLLVKEMMLSLLLGGIFSVLFMRLNTIVLKGIKKKTPGLYYELLGDKKNTWIDRLGMTHDTSDWKVIYRLNKLVFCDESYGTKLRWFMPISGVVGVFMLVLYVVLAITVVVFKIATSV